MLVVILSLSDSYRTKYVEASKCVEALGYYVNDKSR